MRPIKIQHPFLFSMALTSLALLIYYWPWLSGQSSFFVADNNLFFEPLCRYMAQEIRAGALPLWNPLIGCGQSVVANPSPGLFYPGNALFLILSFDRALAILLICHHLISGIGGWLLSRRLGCRNPAAAVCAIALSFNSYLFSFINNFTIVTTAAWVPLLIWSVLPRSTVNAGTRRQLAVAAITALLVIAGRPEISAPALAISALCVVARLFATRDSHRVRKDLLIARMMPLLGMLFGLLIAMPSILPAAEWSAVSPRTMAEARDPLQYSASWYDIISMFVPYSLGLPFSVDNPFRALISSMPGRCPLMPSAFVGTAVAACALLSFHFDKNRGRRLHRVIAWFVAAGFALFLILSAGKNTPIVPLLFKTFPVLMFIRYPEKLLYFCVLALSLLAALGVQRIQGFCVQRPYAFLRCPDSWVWLAFLIAGVMSIFPSMNMMHLQGFFHHYVGAEACRAMQLIGYGTIVSASLALLTRWAVWKSCNLLLIGALASTLFIPPLIFDRPLGAPEFFEKPSFVADFIADFEKKQGGAPQRRPRVLSMSKPEALAIPPAYHQPGQPWKLSLLELYTRQMLASNVNLDYRIGSLFSYEAASTRRAKELQLSLIFAGGGIMDRAPSSVASVCTATGTNYVIGQIYRNSMVLERLPAKWFILIREDASLNVRLYRVNEADSDIYACTHWYEVASSQDALKSLLSANPNSVRTTVLLSRTGGLTKNGMLVNSSQVNSEAKANLQIEDRPSLQITERHNEHIALEVFSSRGCCIVYGDQVYPGWSATIDGHETEILCAHGLCKSVIVPAGNHHIEFTYQPKCLWLGVMFSLIGILLTVSVALTGFPFSRIAAEQD